MGINKISNSTGLAKAMALNSNQVKKEQRTDESEKSSGNESTRVEISSKARELNANSTILEKALSSLGQLEAVRQDRLAEVQQKIEDDFYDSDEFNQSLSEALATDKDLESVIRQDRTVGGYVSTLNGMEPQDGADVEAVKAKVTCGYYNSDEVTTKTADALIDLLS